MVAGAIFLLWRISGGGSAHSGATIDVFYWREGAKEVDFILQKRKSLAAIEVKSGRNRESLSGVQPFSYLFHPKRVLVIGKGGIPILTGLGGYRWRRGLRSSASSSPL